MRLLVPIDGSNESENALEFAVNLQQKLIGNSNKEIIILNIIPHIHIPAGFERPIRSPKSGETISLSDYVEEMNNTIRLEWIEKLSSIKRKYESSDIKIRTEILVGGASISENIIGFAHKENVNMIVIGNIGLGGISKGKALGSVSRKVSEIAKCPVLIVH